MCVTTKYIYSTQKLSDKQVLDFPTLQKMNTHDYQNKQNISY